MAAAFHPWDERASRPLGRELARAVRGEVRFDDGARALYATDASNYRQVPIGVVLPRDVEDVIAAVEVCRRFEAPILSRGGGTALAGQTCNDAVVLDFSRHLDRVLDIDPPSRTARVEPGCVLDTLRRQAERHGLTFAPDPATHDHNCIGGMIGNNSCGVHSVMGGRTADNVESLDVLTYDGLRLTVGPTSEEELARIALAGGRRGDIYRQLRQIRDRYGDAVRARFPHIPRRVSGYNLDELLPERRCHVARALVGTEGTCVIVLGATLRLLPNPPCRVLLVLGYPDVYAAADAAPEVRACGPIGLEGLDDRLIDDIRRKHLDEQDLALLPEGKGWLVAEFGGDTVDEAAGKARRLLGRMATHDHRLLTDAARQARLWEIRESGLGATAFVPGKPDSWPGWEDSAVAPERLGPYLRELRGLMDRYGYDGAFYGHFGDGCLHSRMTFDVSDARGIVRWRAFLEESADLIVKYGGSLSGEHGDGQARAALLPKLYGEDIVQAFRAFKHAWDPGNRLNPGKVVDPYPIEANLRLGARFHPPRVEARFAYPDDGGSFAHATLRCVGVGKCRHHGGGVMCPSFMATHEEMHSTRGRARLLFEMLNEPFLRRGWRNEPVREALDLCLACKGCRKDCPVNVDMATYKAEFLAHYYQGRLRPREAYSMGLVHYWARAASRVPRLANALSRLPGVGAALKRMAGVAGRRELPTFAARSFQSLVAKREPRGSGRTVVLFPDTFNNYFTTRTALAALELLEGAGYRVIVPRQRLCCGRPLYAWGMLDLAQRQLRHCIRVLADSAPDAPVIGLEPACVASFRDELVNLLPDEDGARALSGRAFTLGEFLSREGYRPPRLEGKALMHIHCHEHSVLDASAGRRLLERAGLEVDVPDAGCCGMAGSFGLEASHYDVSMRLAERVLLPRVRSEPGDSLIVADGFSCREQIRQGSGRQALHVAEVLRGAPLTP
jgi:FAD/FMN-containing dehydrogenase/Fe-S oxidoreductase